jgi:2-C-methyl-D-erythritol 2,4-cyclodiphosphate synthase
MIDFRKRGCEEQSLALNSGFTAFLFPDLNAIIVCRNRRLQMRMRITMRIGTGYDVHKLVEGRKLIMGGVEIPYEKGLLGHSDADVLAHAIMDALLGAAALGDIGKHFPDTDERYKGADSMELMRQVRRILEENCYLIGNVDATIIAQAPKMRPFIDQMRQNIADALLMDLSQVSVKATTEERLGFTGRGEGISVQAVALITSPMDLEAVPAYSSEGGCAGCPARQ